MNDINTSQPKSVDARVFTSTTKEPPFWTRKMRALRIAVAPAIPVLWSHEPA